jgi:transposase
MIHGARAVISRLSKHDDRRSAWLKALVARRGFNRTIVALANKTARIAWVILTRKEEYAVRLRSSRLRSGLKGRN